VDALGLADRAADYGPDRPRPAGDPLGERGLPLDRPALDALVTGLCDRLQVAGPDGVKAGMLVASLGVRDSRSLRLLVAYARVHHRRREIIGVPGDRYYWGPWVPETARREARRQERMGRCAFFTAALLRGGSSAAALAQLTLGLVRRGDGDDLAALVEREGLTLRDLIAEMASRIDKPVALAGRTR